MPCIYICRGGHAVRCSLTQWTHDTKEIHAAAYCRAARAVGAESTRNLKLAAVATVVKNSNGSG